MTKIFKYLKLLKKKSQVKGTVSNVVRLKSGKIKHGKGKQQAEVKVPVQVIWESRNISKANFKI